MTSFEKKTLAEKHIGFVNKIALKMHKELNYDYDDVFQWGFLGLMDAIEKYKKEKNDKFEAYAYYRIKGEILEQYRKYNKNINHTVYIDENFDISQYYEDPNELTRPDLYVERIDTKQKVRTAVNDLKNEKQKKVTKLIYWFDFSRKQAGEVVGVKESRASQIHGEAIEKLKIKLKHVI